MLQRATKAVELGDHQLVAGTGDEQCLVQRGAAGPLAAGLVDEDLLAAGGG